MGFSADQVRQACFGMEPTMAYHAEVDRAVSSCFAKFRVPEVSSANGPQTLFSLFRKVQLNLEFEYLNKFGNVKVRQACFGMEPTMAYHAEVDRAVSSCFAKFRAPEVSSANGPQTLFSLFRKKRSPRYPASKVQHLAEEIQTEVDYFRCVMTEMGITDVNNKLKAEAIVARIKSASLAKDLEDSMLVVPAHFVTFLTIGHLKHNADWIKIFGS
ncbi:hypothetical protein FHG87_010162 [Trinorchestia longiramus]|nr:hypothetical protein FHG87_010162 [Trinorchestia longiramus]